MEAPTIMVHGAKTVKAFPAAGFQPDKYDASELALGASTKQSVVRV